MVLLNLLELEQNTAQAEPSPVIWFVTIQPHEISFSTSRGEKISSLEVLYNNSL